MIDKAWEAVSGVRELTSVRGRRVYLSGPMRGEPDGGRAAFAEAERGVMAMGARWAFNPCEHWRSDGEAPGWEREEFLRRDLRVLLSGYVDALVLLDGWGTSAGARLELAVALAVGMPVSTLADLRAGEGS